MIAFANRLPVRRTRNTWRLSDGGLVAALRPAMTSRGGVWVGLGRRHRDADAGRGPRDRAPPGLALAPRGRRVLPRVREPDALAAPARPRRVADLRPLLVGRLPRRQRALRRRRRSRPSPGSAGCTTTTCCCCPSCSGRRARRAGSASSSTSRSRRPRCSRGCRGGRRCSRACSAPTSSRSTRSATATTSCARARSCSTASRSTGRRCGSATAASCGRPRTRSRSTRPISRSAPTGRRVERALAGLRKQFAGRRLLLGVDRLDYTKGIPERLRAIELLLELRPDLRREITFVQVAVPSRGEIREYRELRAAVEQLVGRINGRFTEPGLDVPVHYLYRGVTPDRLLAYYRAAEICLVTPLQDGMNLVAKEYVTVQAATDGHGRARAERVHRRDRGAARGAALQSVRPRGPRGHDQPRARARRGRPPAGRLERMAATVHRHDVFAWLDQELRPPRTRGCRERRSGHAVASTAGEVSAADGRRRHASVRRSIASKGGRQMPPRGVKKGTKRARQYEHIKDSLEQRGALGGQGRGDRGPHRQQGAGPARGGEGTPRGSRRRTSRPGGAGVCARTGAHRAGAPGTSSTRRPGRWASRAGRR